MTSSFACPPGRGPAPNLTLTACRQARRRHWQCRMASAAHARITPPVDAADTARRLRSLAFMGWSQAALSDRLAISPPAVHRIQFGRDAQVPADLAAAVCGLYDRLWDVRGGSIESAQMAARRHCEPPLAWDDDDEDGHGIDDPAAVPADWKPRRRSPLAARAETNAEVLTAGKNRQQVARRPGITRSHLEQTLTRGRRAGVTS